MRGMDRMCRVGAVLAAVVVLGLGAAGCGDDGGGGSSGKPAKPSSAKRVVEPRDALREYVRAGAAGCETAPECQELMAGRLEAAGRVRSAMKAKDADVYGQPIGFVDEAERRADHYGRDNLGAKGNMLAVLVPLQRMVGWFREHPEA